jgi:hypothetical protein
MQGQVPILPRCCCCCCCCCRCCCCCHLLSRRKLFLTAQTPESASRVQQPPAKHSPHPFLHSSLTIVCWRRVQAQDGVFARALACWGGCSSLTINAIEGPEQFSAIEPRTLTHTSCTRALAHTSMTCRLAHCSTSALLLIRASTHETRPTWDAAHKGDTPSLQTRTSVYLPSHNPSLSPAPASSPFKTTTNPNRSNTNPHNRNHNSSLKTLAQVSKQLAVALD